MGSLLEMQAQHTIGLGSWDILSWIFIKGMLMPINRTFVKQINWGIFPTPNFINLVCLESSSNFQGQHNIGSVFCRSCKCSFVQRQYNAYYVTNCISIYLSNYTFPNFIKLIWLDSLWEMQAQHSISFGFLKYFVCIVY